MNTLTLDFLVTSGEVGNVLTLNFLVEEGRRSGNYYPELIYLDEKGRVVDLAALRKAVVEEVQEEPQRKKRAAVRVSERVIKALKDRRNPLEADLKAMRRLLAESQEALAILNAAVQRQMEDDEEAAVLLLAA